MSDTVLSAVLMILIEYHISKKIEYVFLVFNDYYLMGQVSFFHLKMVI